MIGRAQTPKPLSIATSEKDGVTILKLEGDLDNQSLPIARQALAAAVDAGKKRLLFDLERVDYVDSSGLGFFIATLKRVKEIGGEVKLLKLNAYMLGIFRLIHLDYVLDLYDDPEKAMASFGSAAKAAAR